MRRIPGLLPILLILLVILASNTTAAAAERTWTGAVNGRWDLAGNWLGGVAPRAGDSLNFPQNTSTLAVSNQLAASFDNVLFSHGYRVSGLPILARVVGAMHDGLPIEIENRILLRSDG